MVKKIEIDPTNPKTFLSCSTDGTVIFISNLQVKCFDLRDNSDYTIVNLNNLLFLPVIYSISINPVDPNYFIIGGSGKYVRMYDRRFIKVNFQ